MARIMIVFSTICLGLFTISFSASAFTSGLTKESYIYKLLSGVDYITYGVSLDLNGLSHETIGNDLSYEKIHKIISTAMQNNFDEYANEIVTTDDETAIKQNALHVKFQILGNVLRINNRNTLVGSMSVSLERYGADLTKFPLYSPPSYGAPEQFMIDLENSKNTLNTELEKTIQNRIKAFAKGVLVANELIKK